MFAGTAAVLTGFVLAAYFTDVLEDSELDTVDARFAIRGELAPPEDIAIVGIDDPSFRELGEQWPFPRTLHAEAIKQLRADGARVIGYDVQFTEPSENPEDDQELADAIAQAGNVVLATTIVNDRGGTNVFGGDDVLRTLQTRAAHAGYATDAGRVVRRMAHDLEKLDTMAVAIVERDQRREIPETSLPRGACLDRLPRQGERRDDPVLPRGARQLPEGHLRRQDRPGRRDRPHPPGRSSDLGQRRRLHVRRRGARQFGLDAAARLPAAGGARLDNRGADPAVRAHRPADRDALRPAARGVDRARARDPVRRLRAGHLRRGRDRRLPLPVGVAGAGRRRRARGRARRQRLRAPARARPVLTLRARAGGRRRAPERRRGPAPRRSARARDGAVQRRPRLHDLLRERASRRT